MQLQCQQCGNSGPALCCNLWAAPAHRALGLRATNPQTKCREWGLGGKDNKDNLRAKLLRKVRQELGLPVFGPDSVAPGSVRLPQVRGQAGRVVCSVVPGWRAAVPCCCCIVLLLLFR